MLAGDHQSDKLANGSSSAVGKIARRRPLEEQSIELDESSVSFPPWSLRFRRKALEDEFLDFTARPWYASLVFFGFACLSAAATYFLRPRPTIIDQGNAVDSYIQSTRPVFFATAAGCFTFTVAITILLRLGEISQHSFNVWSDRMHMLFQYVFTFVGINFALDSRNCGAESHNFSYIQTCIRGSHYNIWTSVMIQIVFPTGFHVQVPRLCLLPLAELLMSLLAIVPTGQPFEQQASRPFMAFCLSSVFGVIFYTHEHQDRERFLYQKRLQKLTFAANARKQQVTEVLASLTSGEQLKTLLSGTIVEDVPAEATILITSVRNFIQWRHRWIPRHAVSLLGNLFEALESTRLALNVEKVSYRGDELISAAGLRSVSIGVGKVNGDPSRLLIFATKQRFLCKRMQLSLQAEKGVPPILQWGVGQGECKGFLVPGSVVFYLACGPAMTEARENERLSPGGVLEIPLRVANSCREAALLLQPSPRGELFKVCAGVRLNPVADINTVEVVELANQSSVSADTVQGQQAANSTDPAAQHDPHAAASRSKTRVQASHSGETSEQSSSQATKSPNPSPNIESEPTLFLELFRPTQPKGFGEFQEQMAIGLKRFSIAIWFCMVCMYLGIFLLEEDLDLTYGMLCLAALGVLLLGFLPMPSVRWGIFCISLIEYLILIAFPIIRQANILTAFLTIRMNIVFVVLLVVATHVHALLLATLSVLHCTYMLLLVLLHPKGYRYGDQGPAIIFVTLGLDIVILVNRARHHRRVYETLTMRKQLQDSAVAEQSLHEKVLLMLLPRYVVPLIARQQVEGRAKDVVVDHLPDVAILSLLFKGFESWAQMLLAAQLLDSATQSSNSVLHIAYANGDTFCVGGPLHRDVFNLEGQPAVSFVAGRGLRMDVLSEMVADAAAEQLIQLLSLVGGLKTKFVSVLHRSDGLAAVFGSQRPSFALLGPISETAQAILEAISGCSSTVSLATTQFVELSSRFNGAWEAVGLKPDPSTPIATSSIGIRRVHRISSTL